MVIDSKMNFNVTICVEIKAKYLCAWVGQSNCKDGYLCIILKRTGWIPNPLSLVT